MTAGADGQSARPPRLAASFISNDTRRAMSAFGTKADIGLRGHNVCFGGKAGPGVGSALGRSIGLFASNFFRLDSLGLPGLPVVVSGNLAHPSAGLSIAK